MSTADAVVLGHWEEQQGEYRAYLAGLVRRGKRDAMGGAPTFWPLDQPYNRSAEYGAWRRGYDHARRLALAANPAPRCAPTQERAG